MTGRAHFSQYDQETTMRCERAPVTLLGDLGPWRERLYLVGGLAPRYLVGTLPEDVQRHVGTTDIDLVVGMALGDETPETYRTLRNNLEKSGFVQEEPSFRGSRYVDGVKVAVEFLCETDHVAPGHIFSPKGETTGSGFGAFNVRGAGLVRADFFEVDIEGDRLDNGGRSRVTLRTANLLSYVVLKIFAFQDRHENKDAYDMMFTLLNYPDGPRAAGAVAATSAIAAHPQVKAAIELLAERFAVPDNDGPTAYARFLSEVDDMDALARRKREAVATVQEFMSGFAG